MRTPLIAAMLGLSLVGCLVGDVSTPGGGDDDGSAADPGPGGTKDPDPDPTTPKLAVTVDKETLATELMTTNMVTVTLQSSGGFAGSVTLAGSVVDTAGAVIPGWVVSLDKSTVDVAANGTATAVATLKIPSDSHGLAGSLKIDATSSLGAVTAGSVVTVANQLTYNLTTGTNGQCVYPAAMTQNVTNGTKIRWVVQTDVRTRVHIEQDAGKIGGLLHQEGDGLLRGGVYEQTVNGTVGQSTFWYCHSPGLTVTNLRLQVVQ